MEYRLHSNIQFWFGSIQDSIVTFNFGLVFKSILNRISRNETLIFIVPLALYYRSRIMIDKLYKACNIILVNLLHSDCLKTVPIKQSAQCTDCLILGTASSPGANTKISCESLYERFT
jgi:hypothetical protein